MAEREEGEEERVHLQRGQEGAVSGRLGQIRVGDSRDRLAHTLRNPCWYPKCPPSGTFGHQWLSGFPKGNWQK